MILNIDKYNENIEECIERLEKTLNENYDSSVNPKNDPKSARNMIEEVGESLQDQQRDYAINIQEEQEKALRVAADTGLNLIEPPYLPPKDPRNYKEFTLVLDLDETLLHVEEVSNFS